MNKIVQNRIKLKRFGILGHSNVVQLLIDHGSNVSATDTDGNTPLHLAADWGDAISVE